MRSVQRCAIGKNFHIKIEKFIPSIFCDCISKLRNLQISICRIHERINTVESARGIIWCGKHLGKIPTSTEENDWKVSKEERERKCNLWSVCECFIANNRIIIIIILRLLCAYGRAMTTTRAAPHFIYRDWKYMWISTSMLTLASLSFAFRLLNLCSMHFPRTPGWMQPTTLEWVCAVQSAKGVGRNFLRWQMHFICLEARAVCDGTLLCCQTSSYGESTRRELSPEGSHMLWHY